MITKEQITDLFMHQVDCSQITAGEFTEETGLSKEDLYKINACYAGGMLRGETCGAIIGAYNVIGLIYGHSGPDQDAQKGQMLTKMLRFNELFSEKRGEGFMCKELLDADISTKEGMDKIVNGGLMFNVCPLIIQDAVECLKTVINE